jgi:hypothetical protein
VKTGWGSCSVWLDGLLWSAIQVLVRLLCPNRERNLVHHVQALHRLDSIVPVGTLVKSPLNGEHAACGVGLVAASLDTDTVTGAQTILSGLPLPADSVKVCAPGG